MSTLACLEYVLDLSYPQVMGIINVTPDSFSGDGCYQQPLKAVQQAVQMVQAGAALLDIGGESVRPGAKAVSEQEELDRIMPVIAAVREVVDVPLSVEIHRPAVMREALSAGVHMINDICALQEPEALQVSAYSCGPI